MIWRNIFQGKVNLLIFHTVHAQLLMYAIFTLAYTVRRSYVFTHSTKCYTKSVKIWTPHRVHSYISYIFLFHIFLIKFYVKSILELLNVLEWQILRLYTVRRSYLYTLSIVFCTRSVNIWTPHRVEALNMDFYAFLHFWS